MDTTRYPDRLLRDADACAMLGRSRAKFRSQVRAGELPQPVRDGNMTFWRQSELLAVIERMAAARDGAAHDAPTVANDA
jgi:predicted DNA-binding transcriptional regulator AlpA